MRRPRTRRNVPDVARREETPLGPTSPKRRVPLRGRTAFHSPVPARAAAVRAARRASPRTRGEPTRDQTPIAIQLNPEPLP